MLVTSPTGRFQGLPDLPHHIGEGRLDFELHAPVVPLGFDPALLALGGLDVVLLLAAREADHPLHVHLDFALLDENYRTMGRQLGRMFPGGKRD